MLKRILAAGAAAVVLSAAGPASAQMMSDWLPADVKPILTETGSRVVAEGNQPDGQPYIDAVTSRGLKYSVYGEGCDVGPRKRCRGAHLQVIFNMQSAAEAEKALKSVSYAAVGFSIQEDIKVEGSRYLILDHGVTRANFKVNVEVFVTIAHAVWDKLRG